MDDDNNKQAHSKTHLTFKVVFYATLIHISRVENRNSFPQRFFETKC